MDDMKITFGINHPDLSHASLVPSPPCSPLLVRLLHPHLWMMMMDDKLIAFIVFDGHHLTNKSLHHRMVGTIKSTTSCFVLLRLLVSCLQ